jgi:hypothetical protein
MQLIAVYVLLLLIGDVMAYGIGTATERFSPTLSLPVFLASYFAVLWIGWILAVRITEPRKPVGAGS